jgi:hypothetical protein
MPLSLALKTTSKPNPEENHDCNNPQQRKQGCRGTTAAAAPETRKGERFPRDANKTQMLNKTQEV